MNRATGLAAVLCMAGGAPWGLAAAATPDDARSVAAELARSPSVSLANGSIAARVALPDTARGFYRGTRFDWSGMVTSLCYGGQRFYGPWFESIAPSVRDFGYDGDAVVASTMSNATGPAEEFDPIDSPPGFDAAKPGESFIKIGIGVLRRPDTSGYDHYHAYDILDSGHWSSRRIGANSLELIQEVADPRSGYAYRYTKRIELVPGAPRMILSHTLENRGTLAIHSTVYDHNFLTLDGHPTQAGLAVEVPFPIRSDAAAADAAIAGGRATLARAPDAHQSIRFAINGFGPDARDYRITVTSADGQAAVTMTGDCPLDKLSLWSIRSVLAVEPYLRVDVQPRDSFRWRYVYDYRAEARAGSRCPR